MELRVLRYFLAVAREQSITAAAETLHITQPTLSKQLRELEEELGKKLFTRGNRKITLTEEGMFLRKRAQEIVELADKAEADFAAGVGSVSGDIFIGSGETGAVRYLGRTLYKMRSRYPGIRFHLFSGNGEDVSDRLDKGLIDFALFVGMTDLKKYDYLKLPYSHRWGLILRRDDPLAAHEAVTPEMLMNVPILGTDPERALRMARPAVRRTQSGRDIQPDIQRRDHGRGRSRLRGMHRQAAGHVRRKRGLLPPFRAGYRRRAVHRVEKIPVLFRGSREIPGDAPAGARLIICKAHPFASAGCVPQAAGCSIVRSSGCPIA